MMVNWKIEDTANSEWGEKHITHLGVRGLTHAGEKVTFIDTVYNTQGAGHRKVDFMSISQN